ncbi:coatomer subunit beta [Microbotryum lychnidis-dioicae p1A1 Lamole]|uniref:Coatomer subunit beta n=1 Tax=Microbotryum lychnidis-dioicae (strain p1A1 Lamole / MvSl-1064) TaxID=683840 RepID=U5H507_USTV1|nr:coatomer subunit beta [Microbotryum lychnidis-dioicae p1A1 Lamole]|eukprot:KDE07345.1 coatomer subunit beta [Microbotryum lychnidis-dioicae p1A1 Lamole]
MADKSFSGGSGASASGSNLAFTLVADDHDSLATTQDLRAALEKGTDELKLDTLRRIIISTLNGQPHPNLLMPIIQFVLPSKSKHIKKLLHFYWEICPKLDDNGKLKQEMILVCNAIRNDLQHPNEYIRGATLRFLQKIREPELLEPLVPSCRTCLEHRHSFVRKNAVMAVFQIYKNFEYLIPDAPELIQTFMAAESDTTSIRNAFIMLQAMAPQRAVEYFLSIYDQIPSLDEMLQLAVIELIRKESKGSNSEGALKARYIKCIFELLNSGSHSVKYEAATTLTTLTQNPAAVKAAGSCLIQLILQESSNNVKMIVLARVQQLHAKHEHVLNDLVMDVLRVLSSPDMDVRRKALGLAMDMISSRNIEEVVGFLKKELTRTLDGQFEKNAEYRQLLIQTIHTCAIRHSEVASNVVHVLMEFLGDASNASAVDVISFVREVVEKFPHLRSGIVDRLLSTMSEIKSGKVFRGALWIVGEYGSTVEDLKETMQQIRKVLGEVPILASEQRLLEAAESDLAAQEAAQEASGGGTQLPKATTTTRVLADGTYATETAYSSAPSASLEVVKAAAKPPLRASILGGDFYTASVLASSLTKIVLKFKEVSRDERAVNELRAEAMLIMTSIIRVGQSPFSSVPIDEDAQERITNCLQALAEIDSPLSSVANTEPIKEIFLHDTQAAYTKMIAHEEKKAAEKRALDSKASAIQPDDLISFRQFSKKTNGAEADEFELDMTKATGAADALRDDFISKLNRVVQLTGFSDPVYAEAYVNVHQFDIFLDVLIVNQTSETLQNLSVEFATLGDLKLVERPTTHTLGPQSFQSIKATIKVSSTETGVIFGNIFYDGAQTTADSHCVVLNDIHIDILDYINPASCNEAQFRSMWTEFEWENRVAVDTSIKGLNEYLTHILATTNMACLTPMREASSECGYLSANLYARSIFGEDALANLSLECSDEGVITGHVRIRSKQQGIALSLGDKITISQKKA